MIRIGMVLAGMAGALMVCLGGPAQADIAIRTGSHPDFGRIVIDTNGATDFAVQQDGDHVSLRMKTAVPLARAPSLPRNVTALKSDGSGLELTLKPGTHLHSSRINGRVVLDIFDPAGGTAKAKPPPASSAVAKTSPPEPIAVRQKPPAEPAPLAQQRIPVTAEPLPPPALPAPSQPPAAQPAVELVQQAPPGRDVLPENVGPVGLRARRVKPPRGLDGPTMVVPFGANTAAAAYRDGTTSYVIFDERRAVDMAAMKDDVAFGQASIRLLANGTLLVLPGKTGASIILTHTPQGWRITSLAAAEKRQPITATQVDGHLALAAEEPGEVVSFTDPETGATLLAGTQHRPGQAVMHDRRSWQFIMRPSIQGVVVEAVADTVDLKRTAAGFNLTSNPSGLDLPPVTADTDMRLEAGHLTRRFEFAALPADRLLRQSIRQTADAAAAPPQGRGSRNRMVAETLLTMGMAAEAESLLQTAADEDPNEATSPDTEALTAIAALLAGRPAEADGLLDKRLDGSDEIALWRAIRQAMLDEGSPEAAAAFSSSAPLLFTYPTALRKRIVPLVVETTIQGGELPAAARMLKHRENDPELAYARALMQQANGDSPHALEQLDALANGHDQFDRARAAARAVELRLATGALDNARAADALDKLLYAWRGDERELALRERVAQLRAATGAWPAALTILRQAKADFPEKAAAVSERLQDTFAGMIRDQGKQQVPPISFVASVDENADLTPDEDEDVEQALADRLLALDLPARAKPVLEKLLKSAKSDISKARFGVTLATLDAREGDDAAARAVLNGSEAKDLPDDLAEQRMILRAETTARLGDPAAGAAMLAPPRSGRMAEARAQILENATAWPEAVRAWADCAALTIGDEASLDAAATRTILRLATATARAGDNDGLTSLREKYGPRIGAGPLGDMFRLLTAEPVRTSADIQRSGQETTLAASLPDDLNALRLSTATR